MVVLLRSSILVLALSGCARIYSLRAGLGVERTSDDETSVVGAVTLGFAIHATGPSYVVPDGRAGASSRADTDAVLGAGVEWLVAGEHVGLRGGPEYRVEKTLDGDTRSHGVGGRIAALIVVASERGPEEDGLLDLLADGVGRKYSTNVGSACFGLCPSESQAGQVERRHSVGVEASAHALFGGALEERQHVEYVGVTWDFDVIRAR